MYTSDIGVALSRRRQQLVYKPTDVGTFEAFRLGAFPDYRQNGEHKPRISRGRLYTDDEFPLQLATKDHRGLQWLRPSEFMHNPVFIADETTRFDVGQGSVGTCWFLAILASISEYPELMKRVMSSDDYSEREGLFHCKFWRFGQWHDVYIDDCLPVKDYKVWSSRSASNDRELWVSLIEKAFARFHGSYDEVDGGFESNAYLALTGGVSETILVNGNDINPEQLFKRVHNAVNSRALITCSFKIKTQGLITGHAYSLNATETVMMKNGRSVQLLRVRNPWGSDEWKGDWSDRSSKWHMLPMRDYSRIRTKINDGEFWMSLDDAMKYLNIVTICSMTPDVDEDGLTDNLNYITCMYGEWRGPTAAGSSGRHYLDENPKFVVTIPRGHTPEVPIVIQLIQDIKRKKNKSDATSIYIQLYEVTQSGCIKMDPFYKSKSSQDRQIAHRYRLKPGKYMIIPHTKNAGVEKEFLIRIFSESRLEV